MSRLAERDDDAGARLADFLHRLAACPGQVGVEVRFSDVRGSRHVYDPQTGAWWLLPSGDLPGWARRRARPRRGPRRRIGSSHQRGVVLTSDRAGVADVTAAEPAGHYARRTSPPKEPPACT